MAPSNHVEKGVEPLDAAFQYVQPICVDRRLNAIAMPARGFRLVRHVLAVPLKEGSCKLRHGLRRYANP